MAADAAFWGLAPEPEAMPPGVEVWAWHRDALAAWQEVCGQWRCIARDGAPLWLGLDYAAARAGFELAGLEIPARVWAQVRLIEAGAREELNGG